MKSLLWWMGTQVNSFSEPRPGLDILRAAVCTVSWFAKDRKFLVAFLVSVQERQVRLKLIFLVVAKWFLDIPDFSIFWDLGHTGLLPLVLESKWSWTCAKPEWEKLLAIGISKWIVANTWPQYVSELKGRIYPHYPTERAAGGMSIDDVLSCLVGCGSDVTQDLPVFWMFLVGQLTVTAVHQPWEMGSLMWVMLYFFFLFLCSIEESLFRCLHLLTSVGILAPSLLVTPLGFSLLIQTRTLNNFRFNFHICLESTNIHLCM